MIALKSEIEEKQELKDLAKFVTQLTQGYLSKFEQILLAIDQETTMREALSSLDTLACELEAMSMFEFRIERQGEHQRHLMMLKQGNSKPFLLG